MNMAALSLKRPVTILMFFVSMVVTGLIATKLLPLEQFPEANAPFIFVSLPYQGSTPEEVERTITRPVEEALSTLSGIKRMNSNSRSDGAFVFMEFSDWSRDSTIVASQARDRIDAIRDDLPDDFQRYFVQKFSSTDQPVLQLRFSGDHDMSGEYSLIERLFKRRIERLPGVAKVDITGAQPPEVEIAIDSDRLFAHGLSLNELAARLRTTNFSVSAGQIDAANRRLRVQPIGEITDLDQLRDLVLNRSGLRLSDIATVTLKETDPDFRRHLDGRAAVGINVFRERNANLVDVATSVFNELDKLAEEPELAGIQVKVLEDQAASVTSSIDELAKAGLLGALLSLLVLFYFLRHWPSTFMVTLTIPVCFAMTLGGMYFLGMTLNIMSMMGLLLGIGMLVDNAVVVVESIYQYREKYPNDPLRCAIEGTRGVQLAISAGTLTSIIVFAPNLFGERNFISIYLSHVAISITLALLASWLVAVTLIPLISSKLRTPPAALAHHGFVPRMQRGYSRLLDWSLHHRGWSVAGIVLIIGISIVPWWFMKVDMFPNDTGREFELNFQWKGSYSLDQMDEEVTRIENYLDSKREELQIRQIYSWFGEQGWGGIRVALREEGGDLLPVEQVKEAIREGMPKSARAEVGFQNNNGPGGGGDDGKAQMFLIGDSTETLNEIAEGVMPILKARPEFTDVRLDIGDANSEVAVTVDRERAARMGFSAQEVAQYIGIALRGAPLREFRHGDTEVPVTVRFAGSDDFGLADLSTFYLNNAAGERVPLMSLVSVDVHPSATRISRQNRQTALSIEADLADGVVLGDASKAITEAMAGASFPPGYRWSLTGAFDRDNQAGQQMLFNTVLALFMVYLVMAALFESLLFPAAIMSNILFSALGVFWLFALTDTTFSIMSSIGILVLMGVVVNNGIVMIEHINALRRAGMSRHQALVAGSSERLRPILMTMGTTILGMIPLCIPGAQIGGGGPPYYPMARAIVGGLAFSTVVSLLFLPTIYTILDDLRLGTARIMGRARKAAPLGGTAVPEV